jgi:hypothetical protein
MAIHTQCLQIPEKRILNYNINISLKYQNKTVKIHLPKIMVHFTTKHRNLFITQGVSNLATHEMNTQISCAGLH